MSKMSERYFSATLPAALAATLLMSSMFSGSAVAEPRGTLRIALQGFGVDTTAQWKGNTINQVAYHDMYDNLIAANSKGQLTRDGIISDWKASADGTSVVLTNRDGVTFHNGDPVSSEDIKFSIEMHMTGDGSMSGPALRGVIESMEVLNKNQIKVNLTSPVATFPNLLACVEGDIAVIPKKYFESLPGATVDEKTQAFMKAAVYTGAFKFSKRKVGDFIEFGANRNYWDKAFQPDFEKIRILNVKELSTRMNMLRTNEVDLVHVDSDGAMQMAKEGYPIFVTKSTSHDLLMFYESFNPEFLTHDIRFRKALIFSVDRQAIKNAVFPEIPGFGRLGELTNGGPIHAPGVPGYDPDMPFYPYDPDAARRLLEEVGYYDNPQVITAYSFTFASFPEGPKYLEAIVAYWQQVGIKVKIEPVGYSVVHAKFLEHPNGFEPPAAVGVQSPSFRPSMLNNFRIFAVSDSDIKTEVEKALGLEAGGYASGMADLNKADRLYLNAIQQMDPQMAEQAIREIHKEGYEEYWGLPLGTRSVPFAARPGVIKEWSPVPLGSNCPRFYTARRGPQAN